MAKSELPSQAVWTTLEVAWLRWTAEKIEIGTKINNFDDINDYDNHVTNKGIVSGGKKKSLRFNYRSKRTGILER